jgi:hypothetical protein
LALSCPALVAGAALGVNLFRKFNDALFRSAGLVMLLVAGFFLAL